MAHFTLSVFRWSISLVALTASAQLLPDGAGKQEVEKRCIGCHELARSVSLRQDRAGWAATVTKMSSLGMKASDAELEAMLAYLTRHFPADAVPPVLINKARAIELESRLGLRRSQAAAIIRHRSEHGDFKSIEDLKKVPGLDAAAIESKKDRIVF